MRDDPNSISSNKKDFETPLNYSFRIIYYKRNIVLPPSLRNFKIVRISI